MNTRPEHPLINFFEHAATGQSRIFEKESQTTSSASACEPRVLCHHHPLIALMVHAIHFPSRTGSPGPM